MVRKIMSLMLLAISALGVSAQGFPDASMLTPMPLNPKVKSGVLPNGLTYYIMHNEEPKGKANFYIAQKVGSTLETPEQLGLAHFLEHMAFNGTTNFPGKNMLNYLQNKGIRFGADINAYTYYDETVYNIDNVNTSDKPLMDSVLLALHDWSSEILLDEAEIEAERKVILEEWRMRNDAGFRRGEQIYPKIFKEFPYQHMVIGDTAVIMNFKPEVIRDYYKKWYRPDLQGIIVVGDFDADEMEKKVKEVFSTIPKPSKAPKREYTQVSDNKEPIFVLFRDPEQQQQLTTISIKSEKIPVEIRNTFEMYSMEMIIQRIVMALFNYRLEENALEPNCAYSDAGVYFSDFMSIAKTKDAFNIGVIAKQNMLDAISDALAVVMRACKTGFTESEYDRAKDELLAGYEKLYNERDKTTNSAYGKELYRHFLDNEPAPGIEVEYQVWQQALMMYPLEIINEVIQELVTTENMVIVTAQPERNDIAIVEGDAVLQRVKDAMNAQYEAFVDEVITEPLIAELPKPGSVKDKVEDPALGTTIYTLSNGVKVVVKPTDFASDEIIVRAFRNGGKQIYSKENAANVNVMDLVYESSKLGPFDSKTLQRYLAGKRADLSFTIGDNVDFLRGNSTVKDLPTLMELIYATFTELGPDIDTYNSNVSRTIPMLENLEKNPEYIFQKSQLETFYGNNPLTYQVDLETLQAADYNASLALLKDALKNAAEYTFVFTGNIENATIRPLLEQYIATLPVALKKKREVVTPIVPVKGDVNNEFTYPMQNPTTFIQDFYTGYEVPYTVENYIMIPMLGDILQNVFTATLREEEGGAYSPGAAAFYSPNNNYWTVIYQIITNADQQASMIERANAELMKLIAEGTDAESFNRVKGAAKNQYEINSRKNNYWSSMLIQQLRYPDVPIIAGYEEALDGITLESFNNFIKNLNMDANRVQIVMEGVQAE